MKFCDQRNFRSVDSGYFLGEAITIISLDAATSHSRAALSGP